MKDQEKKKVDSIHGCSANGSRPLFLASDSLPRPSTFSIHCNPLVKSTSEEDFSTRDSNVSFARSSGYHSDHSSFATQTQVSSADNSPFNLSPWNNQPVTNPFLSSSIDTTCNDPSSSFPPPPTTDLFPSGTGLIGSLVREEGHIYSLAAVGDLLYTGSDSKNIRVWKDQEEFSSFKSASGLVKTIVISGDQRIFTGHQDGKVRIWKASPKDPHVHKRIGTLPRLKDYIKSSMNPSNYVEVRRGNQRSAVWIRHTDAVSCLCLSEDQSLLYSGSWDRTIKVWRLEDLRCIESVNAHNDTVNAVVVAFDGLVFTGSADGTVKVWRREEVPKPSRKGGKGLVRHVDVSTLVRLEVAVTALAVNTTAGLVYSGSSDGVVSWWERDEINRKGPSGTGGGVLRGHKVAVLCLAAAGSLLFTGSVDTTICVWRRAMEGNDHVCLSVLTGHEGPVKCLVVEADTSEGGGGRWVVYSGSLDKSVKMWKVADPGLAPPPPAVAPMQSDGQPDPPRFDMF